MKLSPGGPQIAILENNVSVNHMSLINEKIMLGVSKSRGKGKCS